MLLPDLFQPDPRYALLKPRHKTKPLARVRYFFALLLKHRIKGFQLLPEGFWGRGFEAAFRHKRIDLYLLQDKGQPHLSHHNQDFTRYVFAAEVSTRIGFGESGGFGFPHNGTQWLVGTQVVEKVVERAGENRLDLQDFIAAVQEVLQGADDRQPRPDVGLPCSSRFAIAKPYRRICLTKSRLKSVGA